MPYEIHLRFGRWDAMLAEQGPQLSFPISTAMWHYARGIAFAAKKQFESASIEQQEFLAARDAIPKGVLFRRTSAEKFLEVAEKMLAGEILYRNGKVDEAVAALREAVRREDNIEYHEPPMLLVPVRHALGAVLMDAGRWAEAESVYRKDLEIHPENGWSLYGLSRSLERQGKRAEAVAVSDRFRQAWQHADVTLTSSCFCLKAKP
jgi:tetratricopeptide (TPR) repeat protein